MVSKGVQKKHPNYKFLPPIFKDADPRDNPNATVISISDYQGSIIDSNKVQSMLTGMNTNELERRREYDLEILSGHISYWNATSNALLAYPHSKTNQNLYVGCEDNLCVLSVSNKGLPNLDVYIHRAQLKNWQQISVDVNELFNRFKAANEEP